MLKIKVKRVTAKGWRGYKTLKGGLLPPGVSYLEPSAAVAFEKMTAAAQGCMEFTDLYRSVLYQVRCIREASVSKRRLYVQPTYSGHNFALSFDLCVDETLAAMRASKNPDLQQAGRSRITLGQWMLQFGWTGIKSESWHFNYLGSFPSVSAKIEAMHGKDFKLSNVQVQECLNALIKESNLKLDGSLGPVTHGVLLQAAELLNVSQQEAGACAASFRRLLAGATALLDET